MDIQMPVMDGIEATRLIRQTKLNIGTPIVALTAHAFNEERDKFLQSGFDDFIAKPIDLNHLLDIIDLWCTQKPADAAEDAHKTQEISVKVPEQMVGSVMTELQSRRSMILGIETHISII